MSDDFNHKLEDYYSDRTYDNPMSSGNEPDSGKKNSEEKSYVHYRATRRASVHFFTALIGFLFPTLIIPFVFAPLSIYYAYLAKGSRKKNDWYNNLIIFFSVVLLVVNAAVCGYSVYSVNHNTLLHQKFDEASMQAYGVPLDEYLRQMNVSLSGVTDDSAANPASLEENGGAKNE